MTTSMSFPAHIPCARATFVTAKVAKTTGAHDGPGCHFADDHPWPVPGRVHTDRVATTGGTCDARNAGASTASCPSSHNNTAPTGNYHNGKRGTS